MEGLKALDSVEHSPCVLMLGLTLAGEGVM